MGALYGRIATSVSSLPNPIPATPNGSDLAVIPSERDGPHAAGRHGEGGGLPAPGQAIMERLSKLSPENAQWSQDLAWFGRKLADLVAEPPPEDMTGQTRPLPHAGEAAPGQRGQKREQSRSGSLRFVQ
jgi:hypothetical protein